MPPSLRTLLLALLLLAAWSRPGFVQSDAALERSSARPVEARFGTPAGALVCASALRGAPEGRDGVAALTIWLDVRGSECRSGCWLRPRGVQQRQMAGERPKHGYGVGGETGFVISLAKLSEPVQFATERLIALSFAEALAWDVMSNASSLGAVEQGEPRCSQEQASGRGCPGGVAGESGAESGRRTTDQAWLSLPVEIDVLHFGETHPTVEALHYFDLRLEGPAEQAGRWGISDGGGQGLGSESAHTGEVHQQVAADTNAAHSYVGGWSATGWQGHLGLTLLHQERTVVWTPPPKRAQTAVLYHHLGMGDHIICAGLVRGLARLYPMLLVVVHRPYLASFARLFRDVPNVHPFAIEAENEMANKDELLLASGMHLLRVGYHKDTAFGDAGLLRKTTDVAIEKGVSFAEIFYRHAGLDYSERWAYPIVPRDAEKEELLWLATQLQAGSYAFVHDDPSRGLFVDRSSVPAGMRIFHPGEGPHHSNVIFDYSLLIERAAELHLMDSAFALLADALDLSRVRRKVLHVYVRINPDGSTVVKAHARLYRQNWELLRVPEGAMHMGFAIDHPVDGEPLVIGAATPEEYNLPVHRRVTFSFLDLSPFPHGGVRVVFVMDGRLQMQFGIENQPGVPYIPGVCPFLVSGQPSMNVGERIKDSFGRCEVDLLADMNLGYHTLELHVTAEAAPNAAVIKAVSTVEVVAVPDDVDPSDFIAPLAASEVSAPRANQTGDGLFWVAVSNGEAVDKLTILNIKKDKIKDPTKLGNIHKEARLLSAAIQRAMGQQWLEHALFDQLTSINRQLWEVEDDVRRCEANKDFGAKFVQLSRSVYRLNDERGRIKREINRLTASGLVEEKHYASY